MSLNNVYRTGITRVAAKATQLGIELPHNIWHVETSRTDESDTLDTKLIYTRLGEALMDHIEDHNLRYVFRLLDAPLNPPDWHYIHFPFNSVLDRFDSIEGIRSRDTALQHVRELCTDQGVSIVEQDHDGVVFFLLDGEVQASVGKMQFRVPQNPSLSIKIRNGLKHLTSEKNNQETYRLMCSLLELPCSAELSNEQDKQDQRRSYAVCSTLNILANSIRKAIERLGVRISNGHAHELLAAYLGFPSWNHLAAIENKAEGICINPAVVSRHNVSPEQHLFFINEAHALAAMRDLLTPEAAFEVNISGTYGTMKIRQPPSTEWPPKSEAEKKSIVCHTVWQIDRYDLDNSSPVGDMS